MSSNANNQQYSVLAVGIKLYVDLYLGSNSSEIKTKNMIFLNKIKFKYSFYYAYFFNPLPNFHTNKGCRYLQLMETQKFIQNQVTVVNTNHIPFDSI